MFRPSTCDILAECQKYLALCHYDINHNFSNYCTICTGDYDKKLNTSGKSCMKKLRALSSHCYKWHIQTVV
jgi:hypothetical protein